MKLISKIIKTIFFSSIFISLVFSKLSSDFGKKQFIVGVESSVVYEDESLSNLKRRLNVVNKEKRISSVFFTPDDDVRSLLLDLITCEKKYIYMAAFLITDDQIAKALVNAKKKGIDVQIVTDKSCCSSRHGKIRILQKSDLDLFVYYGHRPNGTYMSNIMHNKFVLFGENIFGRSLLWTGSFNFTHSARLRNQENILLLDDFSLIEKYVVQFDLLKDRSRKFHNGMIKSVKKNVDKKNTRKKRVKKNYNEKVRILGFTT